MVRSLFRRPDVLMAAYLAVFAYAGPYIHIPAVRMAHRSIAELVVAVVLAIFAARGSRAARVLMIAYSAFGCFVMLFGRSQVWVPVIPRLSNMVCYVFQIALLISTPMYLQSRPEPVPGRSRPPWLPVPRVWVWLASAGAAVRG